MQVPIPSLPTDNLYKFVAISSLFLFVFISTIKHLEYNKFYDALATAQTTSQMGFQQSDHDLDRFMDSDKFDESTNYFEKSQKLHDLYKEQFEQANNIGKRIERNNKIYAFLQTLSLLTMIVGFNFWYTRVQVIQDEIAIASLKKIRLDNSTRNIPQ